MKNGLLPWSCPKMKWRVDAPRERKRRLSGHCRSEEENCDRRSGFPRRVSDQRFSAVLPAGGLDDIGLTLKHESDIAAYEKNRPSWM